MNKVRKVVIPVAGLGTRFYPITKSISKEMLPIIDVPTIQIIIQEAIKSGLEEVIIVNSPEKKLVNHYFSRDEDLEKRLIESGKEDLIDKLREIENLIKITFVYQEKPEGLGQAILCAKEAIGNEPFAVALGDDIVINRKGEPILKQLIDVYNQYGKTVMGAKRVDYSEISKYGSADPLKIDGRLVLLKGLIEKPKKEDAKSNIATLGCHILTPTIFDLLKTQKKGIGGEIQLTDAVARLIPIEGVYAYEFEGERFDVGDKFGYITAIIDFALNDERFRDRLLEYLKEKGKEF